MKYIKKFENINNIEIGDYVICNEECLDDDDKRYVNAIYFSSNNIGKYIKYHNDDNFMTIQFENVPNNIKEFFNASGKFENCRNMYKSEIKMFSKNKEELEAILSGNKYNL